MECTQAGPFVSALFDGERVPTEVADHINGCETCRARLGAYSLMGAELRLIASRTTQIAAVPCDILEKIRVPDRPHWFAFLGRRMLVPRFAMVMAAVALIATSAGLIVVRAQGQARSYWFQFLLQPAEFQTSDTESGGYRVARAGADDTYIWMGPRLDSNGRIAMPAEMQAIGVHYAVLSIQEGNVQLAIRCRRYSPDQGKTNGPNQVSGQLSPAMFRLKEELGLENHVVTYTPNRRVEIPVEGGGTLVLTGQITTTQPKLAWGLPLEPNPDQLVLTSPVVLRGESVVANEEGGAVVANGSAGAVFMTREKLGRLTIGIERFDGAVQGEANWGKLTFDWNGEKYTLFSASPISGGEQPHPVWVRLEPDYMVRSGSTAGIGSSSQVRKME